MPISEQTFRQVALEDPEGHWELDCGKLRQKPDMSARHNDVMVYIGGQLIAQLDRRQFRVRVNSGHVARRPASYYIPDVEVIPTALFRAQEESHDLETYEEPLPFVVEVWSPSTGQYDVDSKLPEYQRRGDLEIWRVHPYDRSVRAWIRQADGSYVERLYSGGIAELSALSGIAINIDALFDDEIPLV
jgi:Uma2 family endonuclease